MAGGARDGGADYSAPAAMPRVASRILPGRDPGQLLAARRTAEAVRVEQRQATRIGLLLIPPVLFLAALAATAEPWWPAGDYATRAADVQAWARGLLAIVFLIVSGQFVTILLVLEHQVGDGEETSRWPWLPLVWVGRLVVAATVVVAVLVSWAGTDDAPSWWTDMDSWDRVWRITLIAEVLPAACLAAIAVWLHRTPADVDLRAERSAPAVYDLTDLDQGRPDPTLRAIGASGGGIRAAAFVLGGHQAVQDRARQRVDAGEDLPPEPHVFAVSGGSYIAAALALRRSYRPSGEPRPDPTSWADSYRLDSPEVERLRRHTRYLFEPRSHMRDGLVTLLMGAAVNLIIVGVLIRLVTWVSAEFALITGVVELTRNAEGKRIDLDLAPGWGAANWALLLSVSLLCALIICALTALSWRSTAAFDTSRTDEDQAVQQHKAAAVIGRTAMLRPAFFLVGVGWLVLVLGLPAATVGLVNLTTSNRPTTTAASVLDSVGFGTRSLCTQALVEQLDRATTIASVQAKVSPDERREVTAGACGVEATVSRTLTSQGTPEISDDVLLPADDDAARDLAETRRIPGQIAGLTAILLLVLGLLRRGPSPDSAVNERWTARVRRVVMTWLPMAIVACVAVYLLLLWTLRFMIYMDPGYTTVAAALTAGAGAFAYLLDANATSLHNFYRGRLSDAFAVAVDDDSGRARPLPAEVVYRYSDLAASTSEDSDTRLHVIATLNSQAPNEAPTMRGGFPVVFGARELSLHREERQHICVPMKDYEDFAGPGRVSIMASVAISGAAITPLMGRYGSRTAPYRLLLALFNIRIGTWVSNPMHTPVLERGDGTTRSGRSRDRSAAARRARWTDALWMTRKPGLAQVALEAVGNSSADRRWVYLSDGGHLDNTGLVESVRFCVEERIGGRILVLDASNDPPGAWSAVGDAISVVRADLGVDLRRADLGDQPPWMRVFQGSGLEVIVVKAVRADAPPPSAAEEPHETDWTDLLPPDVLSFQLTHQDFPRSSTSRQKFGDLEFEAYRSFGYAATSAALDRADRARLDRAAELARREQELEERRRRLEDEQARLDQLRADRDDA